MLHKMEDFYRQMEVGQGRYSSKEWIVSGKVTFLGQKGMGLSGRLPY